MQTPYGGIALLLRCRVFDRSYRLYTLQHACLYRVGLAPSGSQAAETSAGTGSSGSIDTGSRGVNSPALHSPWLLAPPGLGSGMKALQSLQLGGSGSGVDLPPGMEAGPGAGQLLWEGFVSMPGGGNKFTVRRDDAAGLYLALTNPSIDRYGGNPDARNILTLVGDPWPCFPSLTLLWSLPC